VQFVPDRDRGEGHAASAVLMEKIIAAFARAASAEEWFDD